MGYRRIMRKGHPMMTAVGWAYEHRMVAYDNGLLTGPEDKRHVHHKNGDKRDNRVENLEVLTPSEHALHHAERPDVCLRGHSNWYVRPDGKGRLCLDCHKERRLAAHPPRDPNVCARGHSMADAYERPAGGGRMCRTCQKIRESERGPRVYKRQPYDPERRRAAHQRAKAKKGGTQ